MTPKEKAEELFDKMYVQTPVRDTISEIELDYKYSKQCALIAIKEKIETAKEVFKHCWNHPNWDGLYDVKYMAKYILYLEEIKQEIEKL